VAGNTPSPPFSGAYDGVSNATNTLRYIYPAASVAISLHRPSARYDPLLDRSGIDSASIESLGFPLSRQQTDCGGNDPANRQDTPVAESEAVSLDGVGEGQSTGSADVGRAGRSPFRSYPSLTELVRQVVGAEEDLTVR
jgi:hypothetical protein